MTLSVAGGASPQPKLRRLHGVRAVRRNAELVEASRAQRGTPRNMVGAAGIEPATLGLEIRCSIRLSYAPLSKIYHRI